MRPCRRPKVWADARDLIPDPFYDRGGLDKGLFWHLLASLQRVALGFALAAAAGILLGLLVGTSDFAMRGLDPIFQVLRTVPPLAWLPLVLAAFREAQPSAIFVIFITSIWPIIINTAVGVRNVPQDYRNVAAVIRLRGPAYFWQDRAAGGGALHLHRPADRHRPVLAGDHRRGDADRRRRHRLLHLGCVEQLQPLRHHRRAGLCRPGRLRARPHRGPGRPLRHPRHLGELRRPHVNAYLDISHLASPSPRRRVPVLRDIDLQIARGEFVAVIGHSGCGKSTLLNVIAGLLPATPAAWCCEGREIDGPGPDRAVVFQNHSLLPWLTCLRERPAGRGQDVRPQDPAPSGTTGPWTTSRWCRWRTPRTSGRTRSPAA